MAVFLFAIALSAVICIVHAAATGRWDLVRGGVPFAAAFGLLGLVLSLV